MLKSTEIVIEQLIIGLLAIVVLVLFVWGNPFALMRAENDASLSFFFGVFVIIVAYATGIVVDRWSDTLLEQMERRIRIQVYMSKFTYENLSSLTNRDLPDEPLIRLEMRKKGEGILEYCDYLRRRMRITRALTFLMPALFIALALPEGQVINQEALGWKIGRLTFLLYVIILIYSIFLKFFLKRCLQPIWKPILNYHNIDFYLDDYLVPGTHKPEQLRRFAQSRRPLQQPNCKKMRFIFRYPDLVNPALIGLILFVMSGIGLVFYLLENNIPIKAAQTLSVVGSGVVVTCLIGWSWWRISRTYFTLIRNYDRHLISKESMRFQD